MEDTHMASPPRAEPSKNGGSATSNGGAALTYPCGIAAHPKPWKMRPCANKFVPGAAAHQMCKNDGTMTASSSQHACGCKSDLKLFDCVGYAQPRHARLRHNFAEMTCTSTSHMDVAKILANAASNCGEDG
eukprot:7479417-Karenia_brevis.AAC.1